MPPWQIIESLEVEALHMNVLLTRKKKLSLKNEN